MPTGQAAYDGIIARDIPLANSDGRAVALDSAIEWNVISIPKIVVKTHNTDAEMNAIPEQTSQRFERVFGVFLVMIDEFP
jgi:hypothetical protein